MIPTFNIIYLSDLNGLIGINDKQPYYIEDDLKHFRHLTKNQTVVMGRKTYEAIVNKIGRPLRKRHSIVLTNNANYIPPKANTEKEAKVTVVHSLIGVLNLVQNKSNVYVIGGAEIYELFEPLTTNIYHTCVNGWYDLDSEEGHFSYYLPDFSKFTLVNTSELKSINKESTLSYQLDMYTRNLY